MKIGAMLRKTRQHDFRCIGGNTRGRGDSRDRRRSCSACFHLGAHLGRADRGVRVAHVHVRHHRDVRRCVHGHRTGDMRDHRRQGEYNNGDDAGDKTHSALDTHPAEPLQVTICLLMRSAVCPPGISHRKLRPYCGPVRSRRQAASQTRSGLNFVLAKIRAAGRHHLQVASGRSLRLGPLFDIAKSARTTTPISSPSPHTRPSSHKRLLPPLPRCS